MLKTFVLFIPGANADDLMGVTEELNGSSDRSLAVVGASILDAALEERLKRFLHDAKGASDSLFRTGGPLGSFSARIDLGRLVGLYGEDARKEMHWIRDIRNPFAHRFKMHKFTDQPFVDLVKNLVFCEKYTFDRDEKPTRGFSVEDRQAALNNPRDRYLLSICGLLYYLSAAPSRAMPAPHVL